MIERGTIGILVDYYMGQFSPYEKDKTRMRVPIGDSPREAPNLDLFMDIKANLVRTTMTEACLGTDLRPPTTWPDDQQLVRLPIKCERLLFNRV